MPRSVIMTIFFLILTEGISFCEQTDLETDSVKEEDREKGSV